MRLVVEVCWIKNRIWKRVPPISGIYNCYRCTTWSSNNSAVIPILISLSQPYSKLGSVFFNKVGPIGEVLGENTLFLQLYFLSVANCSNRQLSKETSKVRQKFWKKRS